MSETATPSTATGADNGTGKEAPATTQNADLASVKSVDALPEWARNEIAEARQEAARFRVQKNEAVNEAKESVKTQFESQIADLQNKLGATEDELSSKNVELLKLHAAIEADIPTKYLAKFASLLKGSTVEELTAHAQEVKGLFGNTESPVRAVDPSQGSGNNNIPLNGDPLLASLKAKLGIN